MHKNVKKSKETQRLKLPKPMKPELDVSGQSTEINSTNKFKWSTSNQAAQRLHRKKADQNAQGAEPSLHVNEVVASSGRALEPGIRSSMGRRFGHDFNNVRIHDNAQAAQSAEVLNSHAYTLGNHIVFGANQYKPQTKFGKTLLAHELAHVIQQEGGPSPIQGKLKVGGLGDSAEQSADAAAHTVIAEEGQPYQSSALQIRESLRSSSFTRPTIQRAVKTWGGEFDMDKYKLVKSGGVEGVDMTLRFKPNKHVDAELIGMTQTARSLEKGVPVPASAFNTSKAEEKAFESYRITKGKDKGTMIDQLARFNNPLYATGKTGAKDTLATTATSKTWGQHGKHFKDKAGKLKKQDALLIDEPTLRTSMKQTSQTFETTALAIKGEQSGTFYGSVQWGWEKNAAGKVKTLPFKKVSNDVPSAVFAQATGLWNKAKNSKGKATIDLPIVTGKYVNAPGVWLVKSPSKYKTTIIGKLPKNTRLEATDKGTKKAFNKSGAANQWWKVTVVSGAHIGKVGWVMQTYLSDKKTK